MIQPKSFIVPRSRSPRAGLTLLELVVVVALLAILAGLVVPRIGETRTESVETATRHNLRQLQTVIMNRYYGDKGMLPAPINTDTNRVQSAQLNFLFENPDTYNATTGLYTSTPTTSPVTRIGWNGPYMLMHTAKYPPTANGTVIDFNSVKLNDPQSRTWTQLGYTATYGLLGDPAVLDGAGSPIVIRVYDATRNTTFTPLDHLYTLEPLSVGAPVLTIDTAVLVSAGADGSLIDPTGTTLTDNLTLKLQ